MNKILYMILLLVLLVGCNRQIIDFNYKFNKAYIKWPDGTSKTVDVKKWADYNNSDTVQIIDNNGNVYLTHYANVVLTYEKN